MTARAVELLPCPFCGGSAELKCESGSWGYYPAKAGAGCKSCGAQGPVIRDQEPPKHSHDYRGDAIAAWNRQALAADRAEAGELPELPPASASIPSLAVRWGGSSGVVDVYTADQLRAYGQQCARAASCGGGEVVAWIEAEPSTPDSALFSDVPMNMIHSTMVHICKAPPTKRQPANKLFPLYATPPTPSAGVVVTDVFREQMDMLREDFRRHSDGDPKVPWIVVREALVAALNEWDALTAALEGGKSP